MVKLDFNPFDEVRFVDRYYSTFPPSQCFALTISPPPFDSMGDIHRFHDKVMCEMNKFKKWILFPEIDKTGRFHYHGIFIKKSMFQTEPVDALKLLCFICIKKVTDPFGWLVYIRKTWSHHKRYWILNGSQFEWTFNHVRDVPLSCESGDSSYTHRLEKLIIDTRAATKCLDKKDTD